MGHNIGLSKDIQLIPKEKDEPRKECQSVPFLLQRGFIREFCYLKERRIMKRLKDGNIRRLIFVGNNNDHDERQS